MKTHDCAEHVVFGVCSKCGKACFEYPLSPTVEELKKEAAEKEKLQRKKP